MSKKSEIKIEWVDPKDLKPYKNNSKLHPQEQLDGIKKQITEFGFDVPIVALPNKVIVKGHGRREAALQLGLKKVPVIFKAMDEAKALAARIADNKLAESGFDFEALRVDFKKLNELKFDLGFTGFSTDEINVINSDWKTDFDKVSNEKSHLDGIKSFIKVRCDQEHRTPIKEFLITKLAEAGFKNVEVE